MAERRLPVRPNLTQLKNQAKDLLLQYQGGDPTAIEEFRKHHPEKISSAEAKLADAQLVLARSYEASGWTRLVLACKLIDGIWRDDLDTVRSIIEKNPKLLHENAGIRNSNWGPPMSYAANLGRDAIIRMLYEHGARDLEHAIGRAALQGKIETARMLYVMRGALPIPQGALAGPAYTLSSTGTAFLFEHGAMAINENGATIAPVDVVICSDSRKPAEKHRILEMYVQHGAQLPDTPVMALHRGRIDLLEDHLRRDRRLFERTFSHQEVFPPDTSIRKARRSTGPLSFTCASIGMNSRSRNGSSKRAPTSTRNRLSIKTASEDTHLCLARWFATRISGATIGAKHPIPAS